MLKRYQYLSKCGIKWTKWFHCVSIEKSNIQIIDNKFILKNEYSTN